MEDPSSAFTHLITMADGVHLYILTNTKKKKKCSGKMHTVWTTETDMLSAYSVLFCVCEDCASVDKLQVKPNLSVTLLVIKNKIHILHLYFWILSRSNF